MNLLDTAKRLGYAAECGSYVAKLAVRAIKWGTLDDAEELLSLAHFWLNGSDTVAPLLKKLSYSILYSTNAMIRLPYLMMYDGLVRLWKVRGGYVVTKGVPSKNDCKIKNIYTAMDVFTDYVS